MLRVEPTVVSLAARAARHRVRPLLLVGAALVGSACAAGRMADVSPAEIPDLEARLAREPEHAGVLLRYAAALFAAHRCDSAQGVARRGRAHAPAMALGPLVLGQCYERAGRYDEAVAIYREYLAAYDERPGAPAVRAREVLALRARAVEHARAALARETELTSDTADPRTVAVLPLDIVSADSGHRPLGRGLAQMLVSDLALLQQFRLVERLQVGALLDEIHLAETGRADPATAARAGRLLRAGRMVQGLAALPPDDVVRLEASVVRADGTVTEPAVATGRFRELLRLEKELVVELAAHLGYVLSEAERRRVLENGTQNLAAFLAYSRGLDAEDRGEWSGAAAFYRRAVADDPTFEAARVRYEATAAMPEVLRIPATRVTAVAAITVAAPVRAAMVGAIGATVGDLAPTLAELTAPTMLAETTRRATGSTTALPPPTIVSVGAGDTATGTLRLLLRLP